ncbi:kinase [Luedemannella helvata]|uniref:kinase n=1 Tax=Luedemannella helvata TaxID=349315 RepID=UPI0031D8D013
MTAELLKLDDRFVLYQRLKVGAGRSAGYRLVSPERFRELEEAGEILYRNERYGNVYGIDRQTLDALTVAGCIPVVHIGQAAGLAAMDGFPARWLRVLLWCERVTTERRSAARGDGDTAMRLAVWEETKQDLDLHPDILFDVKIQTDQVAAIDAAQTIHHAAAGATSGDFKFGTKG